MKLEQVDISKELDTGASMTVISKATLDNMQETTPTLQVQPTNVKLRTYTGEEIPVVGRVTVKLQHLKHEEQLSLVVVIGPYYVYLLHYLPHNPHLLLQRRHLPSQVAKSLSLKREEPQSLLALETTFH